MQDIQAPTSPVTLAQATTDSIGLITDPGTLDQVYGSVKLADKPATGVVVAGTYYEELETFVTQDVTSAPKQNVKKVEKIGDVNIMYGYGSIDISLKSDQVVTNKSMEMINKLLFKPYTGNETVEEGLVATQMVTKPIPLLAELPVTDYDDDVIGTFKFQSCKLSPALPTAKAGDVGKFTIDMSIQEIRYS